MVVITGSEGLTKQRINSKFGRILILILDDGSEAQDNSANKMEYLYLFYTLFHVQKENIYLFYNLFYVHGKIENNKN